MIVAMGDNATLVLAVTAADLAHLQKPGKGTLQAETLTWEGPAPLGLVQNVVILYADDSEKLIEIFRGAGVDVTKWSDRIRSGERTDKPKKGH